MNTTNPTALRIGQQALIEGRRYTVRGRVVLSMVADDGVTYFWNEFNLTANTGQAATLVFEETENGPVWKWFELYEPARAMSAAEAAAQRVGEWVDFGDGRARVTLVDETLVRHIEGEAPEGVEVGDVAHYFNAELGQETLVASWTGEEIEFYRGYDLARGRVEELFNLPRARASSGGDGGGGDGARFKPLVVAVAVRVVLGILGTLATWRMMVPSGSSSRASKYGTSVAGAPQAAMLPPLVLALGATGVLEGKAMTVRGKALVRRIAMEEKRNQTEYELVSVTGESRWLVQWKSGYADGWSLYTPEQAPAEFSAYDAAALLKAKTGRLPDGRSYLVNDVFMCETRAVEGELSGGAMVGGVRYGVSGMDEGKSSVMRWTPEAVLSFYRVRKLGDGEVRSAFAAVEGEKGAKERR